jgi:hypothetical protein
MWCGMLGPTSLKLWKKLEWLIRLPPELDKRIDEALQVSLEGEPMQYLNYWERKGKNEGKQDGKIEILELLNQEKFGQIPSWALEKLEKAEPSAIEKWCRAILRKNSLEEIFSA